MKKKTLNIKKISDLETIEEKSFWITAPIIAFLGFLGIATSGFYASAWPTIVSALLCFVFPTILILFVVKNKNYHIAYPLLCITIGAVSVPFTFIFSGGFLSGMPLFCALITSATAFCYSRKLRYASLIICLLANTLAFIYVYLAGTPSPLQGTEVIYLNPDNLNGIHTVYNDILFGYYCSSVGMFAAIGFITRDIQRYKLNQDALQKFFDGQKRNEIIKNALDNKLGNKTERGNAAIIFADVSKFTKISEHMDSNETKEFLNEFFSAAVKNIHATGGIIDKYIGDCIMAYWIDDGKTNCVLSAVQSMWYLKTEINSRAQEIHDKYGAELIFHVGIGYGDVIFGDIGTDEYHDYTVIGDAVNVASRITDLAVGGQMLIDDRAAKEIDNDVILEKVVDNYYLYGRNASTNVYNIVGLTINKKESDIIESKNYGYVLNVCGCRGSFPVSGVRFAEYGGETSCYIMRKDEYALIVDCGTGLKNAMELVEGCKQIDVLLTHVHYDHILGFLMSKFPLDAKIRLYGRFNLWNKGNNTLEDFMQHPYWPVEIIKSQENNIEIGKEIKLTDEVSASFYESDHPDNGCVIKIMINDKKIVFLADCENASKLDREISKDADIVFFDGMFDDNDTIDHKGWGHGTWQDGVRFAKDKENNIKKLVITHHNPELGDQSLKERELKANKEENKVSFAKSGDIHII